MNIKGISFFARIQFLFLEIPHFSRYAGFVLNDNINKCNVKGKQWRFVKQIATASPYTT
jgi:hypothetical protein